MAATESKPILDVLTLDKPEQLKALGHPLRLRVLETLGAADNEHMTNRELAGRLGVDPGHLHFHVRMLLRAGLIELADSNVPALKAHRGHVLVGVSSGDDPRIAPPVAGDVLLRPAEARVTGLSRAPPRRSRP